jgi:histidinol-phosphate aminotransferase
MALFKENNIVGKNIFEETGKWSRIIVGSMDEMKQFISVLE